MIINKNIEAMKAFRSLNINNKKSDKTMEKLSSGMKINRAADDSAGLAISVKMRAQIRGLTQNERNIDDGISMFSVAEGGMEQIESMIHRIRELAVQSANDTNVDEDRVKIQEEVRQLIGGIDEIANDTEFNTHKVLQGEGGTKTITITVPQTVDVFVSKKTLQDSYNTLLKSVNLRPDPNPVAKDITVNPPQSNPSESVATYFIVGGVVVPPGAVNASGTVNVSNYTPLMDYFLVQNDAGFGTFLKNMDPANIDDAKHFINTIAAAMNDIIDYYYPGANLPEVKGYVFDLTGKVGLYLSDGSKLEWGSCNPGYLTTNYNNIPHNYLHNDFSGGGMVDVEIESTTTITSSAIVPNKYIIQVGPNEDQNILFEIPPMPAIILGITPDDVIANADVSTQPKANDTIALCDIALDYVNIARSMMGSHVNRLEAALSGVVNSHLNLSAAESRLRDTDMSKELAEQVKTNILTQSATAMLTQANQRPEGVLQLLR